MNPLSLASPAGRFVPVVYFASCLLGLALVGCTTKPADDTAPPADTDIGTAPLPLPDPVIALAVRTPHGTLLPTCEIGFDVYEGGEAGTVVAHVAFVSSRGGEWAAFTATPGTLYAILGTDVDCTDASDEEPQMSGAFSLEAGEEQIWWWRSTSHGFELLHEGEDFDRGRARLTVDDGADGDEVIAYAESVGAVATADAADPTGFDLTFDETVAVPTLLAQMSLYARYTEGDPAWRGDAPGWW